MADIFSSEPIEPEAQEVTLATLVGDDRKYKTPDELAKAYAHAEPMIERLKAQLAEKEAEAKILKDLEEARLRNVDPNNPARPQGHQEPPADPSPSKVTDADLKTLVREELQNSSEEKRRADNVNQAAEVMAKHYGSPAKAQEAIARRAQELGVSFEWLKDAAAQSPKAFLASMGVNLEARPQSTPGYSHEVNINGQGGKRDFRYWDEMRKANPKAYYSREIQKQMFDARRELGENFYTS
jgi:hypothetical protein